MCDLQIHSENIYNMDEKRFPLGRALTVRLSAVKDVKIGAIARMDIAKWLL